MQRLTVTSSLHQWSQYYAIHDGIHRDDSNTRWVNRQQNGYSSKMANQCSILFLKLLSATCLKVYVLFWDDSCSYIRTFTIDVITIPSLSRWHIWSEQPPSGVPSSVWHYAMSHHQYNLSLHDFISRERSVCVDILIIMLSWKNIIFVIKYANTELSNILVHFSWNVVKPFCMFLLLFRKLHGLSSILTILYVCLLHSKAVKQRSVPLATNINM